MTTESFRHAIASKVQYESFVSLSLGCYGMKALVSSPAEYERLFREDQAEEMLEYIEPTLTDLCRRYGYQYASPCLSDAGIDLLLASPLKFIKAYALLLKNLERDPFATTFI